MSKRMNGKKTIDKWQAIRGKDRCISGWLDGQTDVQSSVSQQKHSDELFS